MISPLKISRKISIHSYQFSRMYWKYLTSGWYFSAGFFIVWISLSSPTSSNCKPFQWQESCLCCMGQSVLASSRIHIFCAHQWVIIIYWDDSYWVLIYRWSCEGQSLCSEACKGSRSGYLSSNSNRTRKQNCSSWCRETDQFWRRKRVFSSFWKANS